MTSKKLSKKRARLLPWSVLLVLLLVGSTTSYGTSGVNTVGVNAHIPSSHVVDMVTTLGVKWVRLDNPWHEYANACSPDMPFPVALDTAVQYAVQQGLQVYLVLGFTPPCASTGGSDEIGFNDPPVPALFADYVRRSVARYRQLGVRHFGLWNEPNLSFFFEGEPEAYVDNVVLPGFAGVAQGCAEAGYNDCLVLGPDLSHQDDYDDFLKRVLRRMQAVPVMFHIFTHHIYQPVATPLWERDSFVNALDDQRLEATRPALLDVLKQLGLAPDGIPVFEIWITETGMRVEPPTDPQGMAEQAARYMEVLNVQAARPWYTNTFFYEIIDAPSAEHAGYGLATMYEDGSVFYKDAYFALQSRLANDPRFAPNGPPPGYLPNASTTCARLGKSGFIRILDQDKFAFDGLQGELVTATLNGNANGSHEGSRATLMLEGNGLYFVSQGPLFNDITTTLPESGRYRIYVAEQMGIAQGSPFRGDYCLTLESSYNAHTTLRED